VTALRVIASVLAPSLEWHRYETMKHLDTRLEEYLGLADNADSAQPPLLAEERSFLLQQSVEAEKGVVNSAPLGGLSVREDLEGPATQRVITALMALRKHPLISGLESQLLEVWTPTERYPAEVFRLTLASKSWTCIAILFGNLSRRGEGSWPYIFHPGTILSGAGLLLCREALGQ
jgi:hypothetical protein